jgi:CheY-like chemotaxis protein
MPDSKPLEALFPGSRRVILAAMFGEPERWFSMPELAGRAGVQPDSLRFHIAALREGGVIRGKEDGGCHWYQADPGCPVYAELQSMVTKLTTHAEGETILVVEDQPATARITRILLESWGYRVLEAHGGLEALGVYERHDGAIHLLLTDVSMPGMTGPELVDELRRRRPGLRVVFMSGYPTGNLGLCNAAFLSKPFNPARLSRMIRKELDRAEAPARRMNASLH